MSAPADNLWRSPLVPVALAATAGIVLDRFAVIPLAMSLTAVVVSLAAWLASRNSPQAGLPVVYLMLAVAAVGAAYHHVAYRLTRPDDIGHFATETGGLARVRGVICEGPATAPALADPLRSFPRPESTLAVLEVDELHGQAGWTPVSGRLRLTVEGRLNTFAVGDHLEATGWLSQPPGPANPGEFDQAAFLRDQRIHARIHVQHADAIRRLSPAGGLSITGWLAWIRSWAQRRLEDALPGDESSIATALLLGDGRAMSQDDWDRYIRTGVIHVLAISGQHLMVLAAFLWWLLRLTGIRRRHGAAAVAVFLFAYALLTGGRPPVLRSAVMVGAAAGGLMLQRIPLPANLFALAWLAVALVNPMDIFNAGCQLSFLSVAVILWGTSAWFTAPTDPLDRLIDETRPAWLRLLRSTVRRIALSYAVTLAVWLALAPLIAARYHLVSPVGILLGPPAVLLTSVALVSGFLLLLAAAVFGPLVPVFAWITQVCLAGCNGLVWLGERCPGGYWYVGQVPDWWLWVFYVSLLAVLLLPWARWRYALPGGLAWLCVGLAGAAFPAAATEFRCTFLAVGHGSCIVLESSDGRVILYDAGALNGPEVARRQIAPYLWSRNIRRIDEVLLSHGDLDHFNGLPDLLDRFGVGQVTLTPSFADRPTEAIRVTLDAIERRGVPVRVVRRGDVLAAGDIEMEILHPPAAGPEGNENARSLVLEVRHGGRAILLTGDLEGAGLDTLLRGRPRTVDVLMAPHHGSRTSNIPTLADWARPKVVVSCEGPPRGLQRPAEPYSARGAHFIPTWPHGAVTITHGAEGLIVETFRSRQRIVVR